MDHVIFDSISCRACTVKRAGIREVGRQGEHENQLREPININAHKSCKLLFTKLNNESTWDSSQPDKHILVSTLTCTPPSIFSARTAGTARSASHCFKLKGYQQEFFPLVCYSLG